VTVAGDDPGRDEQLGGRSPLRITVRVGRDVADAFATLDGAVREHTAGTIEADLTIRPPATAREVLEELTASASADGIPADVVVFSLADDVDTWASAPEASGTAAATAWTEAMRSICGHLKARGSRVFVCNASTVVPNDHCSSFRGVDETASVFTNRLDARLIELSVDEGLSIIDVDGMIAELGADQHVSGLLQYSPHALDAIRTDFVRILDDYGFFHPRPLLPQRGQREQRVA
jgi:hypothetical protein